MTSVEVHAEQFPIISGQLDAIMAEALQSITAAAPTCLPAPPGGDFVSPMLLAKCQKHAAAFFPTSLQGIDCGQQACKVVPKIGAAYTEMDILGEINVAMQKMLIF